MKHDTDEERLAALERALLVSRVLSVATIVGLAALWWSSRHPIEIRARTFAVVNETGAEVARLGVGPAGPILILKGDQQSVLAGSLGRGDVGLSVVKGGVPSLALSSADDGSSLLTLSGSENSSASLSVDAQRRSLLVLRGQAAEVGIVAAPDVYMRVKSNDRVIFKITEPSEGKDKAATPQK
jgi:hypothetical protein